LPFGLRRFEKIDQRCRRLRQVLVSVGLSLAFGSSLHVDADAQGVVTQKNLSLSMAKTFAEGALDECKKQGFNTAVAVLDRAGQVLVLLRDEAASAVTLEMARRKAYTAKRFRTSSLDWAKRTMDPALAPQRNLADVLGSAEVCRS
jgi:hypothetical protein